MLPAVLAVRFLVELGLLAGAAVAGSQVTSGSWQRVIVALLAAGVVATLWGTFLSPKARVPLSVPARVALEVAVFVVVSAGLWQAGFTTAALVLMLTDIAVLASLFALGERPGRHYEVRELQD